ncbi:MAG: hypothetical protein JST43_00615 [Bacteroidetes bacterium]|nr:hypothetical protein [Bacteroidota bacterium]
MVTIRLTGMDAFCLAKVQLTGLPAMVFRLQCIYGKQFIYSYETGACNICLCFNHAERVRFAQAVL